MIITIPDNRDDVEYIEGFFNIVLSDTLRNGIDWDFVDDCESGGWRNANHKTWKLRVFGGVQNFYLQSMRL